MQSPPRPPTWRERLVTWLVSFGFVFTAGCTTSARGTASSILDTGASAVPFVCSVLPASDAQVCGVTTSAVSDVARLIASILQSLPAGERRGAADLTPTVIAVHGCVATLPAFQAAAVLAKLR